MKLVNITLVGILLSFSAALNANEKNPDKDWEPDNSDKFLKMCIVSAVNKNMKHLVEKKIVTLGSDKYNSILKKVRQHQTLVCQCTQDNIRENKSFVNIAKKCFDEAMGKQKKI